MSKSYNNTLNLSDSQESIKIKVATMFTDPKRIRLTDKGHPDVCNVFAYYSLFIPKMKDEVFSWCTQAKIGCTDCKRRFALELIEKLKPFHQRRKRWLKDKTKIIKILEEGARIAAAEAQKTIKEVKAAMKI
jgi:tryptophanyl-tRNA synthetase